MSAWRECSVCFDEFEDDFDGEDAGREPDGQLYRGRWYCLECADAEGIPDEPHPQQPE